MSIRDEARANMRVGGQKCLVKVVKAEMPAAEQAELDEALNDVVVTAAAIARVLRGRGYKISEASLQRHRRRECHCE